MSLRSMENSEWADAEENQKQFPNLRYLDMTPSETMTPVTKQDNRRGCSVLSPLEENLQNDVSEKREKLLSDAVKKAIPQKTSELRNHSTLKKRNGVRCFGGYLKKRNSRRN